jgi:hypothetical protein
MIITASKDRDAELNKSQTGKRSSRSISGSGDMSFLKLTIEITTSELDKFCINYMYLIFLVPPLDGVGKIEQYRIRTLW